MLSKMNVTDAHPSLIQSYSKQCQTDDQRWKALTRRDPLTDQEFVYCVKTTGIYCRPTCPSRLARRANVVYYDHFSQAKQAGFRPCKRCKPEVEKAKPSVDIIAQACQSILSSARTHVPVSVLACDAGLSITQFRRLFKKRMGMTPTQYGRSHLFLSDTASNIPSDHVTSDLYNLITSCFTPEELQTSLSHPLRISDVKSVG
ncbi:hypothetical protein K7432_007763 [Basidiobolus ranarum]|uniref:HTH araC/xylS-type domain-containing protein n=1 Tax=Basidiobolus ranarum TaxID=34480 RepID=A0ABR2VZM4_9FUNG